MDEKTYNAVNGISAELFVELVAYAEKRLTNSFRSEKSRIGWQPSDFVCEVFTKVLNGERKWNPEKTPNFKEFLFSAVKSEVSNFVTKKSNKMQSDADNNPGQDFWSGVPAVEDALNDSTEEEVVSYIFDKLNEIDISVGTLLLYEMEGYSAKEIAEDMKISVDEVYNLRKKLKRHGERVWHEFNKKESLK